MKKFEFETVRDAIETIDVAETRQKIKNSVGLAFLTKSGTALEHAQDHAEAMLRFIDTGDLKRELEKEFAETGKIDFLRGDGGGLIVSGEGVEPQADYFTTVILVDKLLRSWKSRRNNVTEMKPRNR